MSWPATRLTRTARYIAASTAAGRSTINKVGQNSKVLFDILRHYGYYFSGDLCELSEKSCIFDFVEDTHAWKYSNKFGISLAYSYLCSVNSLKAEKI